MTAPILSLRGISKRFVQRVDFAGKIANAFGAGLRETVVQAVADFDRAYTLNPALLQAQVGKALSEGIHHQPSKGLEIIRAAESKVEARGVGDPEALYKLAEAYALLGDHVSALRMLKHSIDTGFFPVPYFTRDPLLDSLRSDAQFPAIMRTANVRYEAFKKKFF